MRRGLTSSGPIVICPDCGAGMTQRNGKNGAFYGCSSFPRCKGTRKIFAGETKARPTKSWSVYQQAVFDAVVNSKQHIVVEAVAGGAKTSTAVEASFRYVEKFQASNVLFLAFNTHIAVELQSRLPSNVDARTLHSLGFSVARKLGDARLDGGKLDSVISKHWPKIVDDGKWSIKVDEEKRIVRLGLQATHEDRRFASTREQSGWSVIPWSEAANDKRKRVILRSDISRMVSMLKNVRVEPTVEALKKLDDFYTMDITTDLTMLQACVMTVLEGCRSQTATVDFDDMIWLPLELKMRFPRYDLVFVDEAQDLNAAQHEMLDNLVDSGARIVAIGDRYQSIYSFRGADCDSIPNLAKRLHAKVLPLSVSYRCPASHVDLARAIVPHIEAAPNAKPGEVVYDVEHHKAVLMATAGDGVLCRTNAPVVRFAFDLIRAGKKAVVRGRDIGSGLINLARKLSGKSKTLANIGEAIEKYRDREMERLGEDEQAKQAVEDKLEVLGLLVDGIDTLDELNEKIESLFSDDVAGIVCSSVHKAKGLEWPTTWILLPYLMPLRYAKTPEQIQQEMNVKYVALTRSLNKMSFVDKPQTAATKGSK